ncbi:MAG: DUF1015 domain-containing protein [Desulfatiglandales bacterium]
MAIIAPFKGITYNWQLFKEPSHLLAPPYDVISEEEQDYYYLLHPHNIIRLILGKKRIGDSDWDNRYTRAADHFKRWLEEGVLVRAKEPCLYLTSVRFKADEGGPTFERWGVIGLVRIEEPDSSVIMPHEKTFSAHKEDRLKLMRACNAQFSQIFGLYEDGDKSIKQIIDHYSKTEHLLHFTFRDNTEHKFYVIKDPSIISTIYNSFLSKKILIADGHHRYETARIFRNIMRTKYDPKPSNRSYEYTMMYLADMLGEGLVILPTHRLVRTAPLTEPAQILNGLKDYFHVRVFKDNDLGYLLKELKASGRSTPSFLARFRGLRDTYLLSLQPTGWDAIGDDLDPSLKVLDVMVLSRLFFQKVLGFKKEHMDREEIFHYTSDPLQAFEATEKGEYLISVLMNPTKIEQVRDVAQKGLVMPRKSTFFYPKVLSGLVLNKIDPYEIVYVPESER